MTLDWAMWELDARRREQSAVEASGSWDDFARMKYIWAKRRKEMGYSRAVAKYWLEKAERECDGL